MAPSDSPDVGLGSESDCSRIFDLCHGTANPPSLLAMVRNGKPLWHPQHFPDTKLWPGRLGASLPFVRKGKEFARVRRVPGNKQHIDTRASQSFVFIHGSIKW
jgi:hypothetical protein